MKTAEVLQKVSTNIGKEITTPKYSEKYVLLVSAFVPFKNGLRAIWSYREHRMFSAGWCGLGGLYVFLIDTLRFLPRIFLN